LKFLALQASISELSTASPAAANLVAEQRTPRLRWMGAASKHACKHLKSALVTQRSGYS